MRNSQRTREGLAQCSVLVLLVLATGSIVGQCQDQAPAPPEITSLLNASLSQEVEANQGPPTPLAKLIDEAENNNPQILAARHAWKAATLLPSQASAPPDPQITVQQFAVGSPRPFAGFSNSDFAYVGLGVSQDLPYPGKLRLRGEIAQQDASGGARALRNGAAGGYRAIESRLFQARL